MDDRSLTKNKPMLMALAALLIGGIIGYALHPNNNKANTTDNNKPSASSQGVSVAYSDLRVNLNGSMREHAAIALPLLKAQLQDTPDAADLQAAMDKNSTLIASQVGAVYNGKNNEFLQLWNKHLGYYKDYVVATKAHDDAGKQAARNNLIDFSDKLASFFANNNPKYNKSDLKAAFTQHGNQTLTLIDQLNSNDFKGASASADEAYQHMGSIADMLAEGVHKQMPNKY